MSNMRHSEAVSLMGKKVMVTSVFKRRFGIRVDKRFVRKNVEERWWEPEKLDEPRAGWIVGISSVQRGIREYVGYEEGYQWTTEKATPCLLITFWPNMKPVKVPLDGWRHWYSADPEIEGSVGDPEPYPRRYKMNDCERKRFSAEMRDIMENWPRDNDGRWLKAVVDK